MTPSQIGAIEKKLRTVHRAYPDATHFTWTPARTDMLRLMISYEMPNMTGGIVKITQCYTVGTRGKISDE